MRVAKKDDDGITDEFVQRGAVLCRDKRHFPEIAVEQLRDFFRLPLRRRRREILDVGEKDGQLFALRLDFRLAGPVKKRLVDLGRKVAGQLLGQDFEPSRVGAALQMKPYA